VVKPSKAKTRASTAAPIIHSIMTFDFSLTLIRMPD
jgi:hypothetical protein